MPFLDHWLKHGPDMPGRTPDAGAPRKRGKIMLNAYQSLLGQHGNGFGRRPGRQGFADFLILATRIPDIECAACAYRKQPLGGPPLPTTWVAAAARLPFSGSMCRESELTGMVSGVIDMGLVVDEAVGVDSRACLVWVCERGIGNVEGPPSKCDHSWRHGVSAPWINYRSPGGRGLQGAWK